MNIDRRTALAILSSARLAPLAMAQSRASAGPELEHPSLGNLFPQIDAYARALQPRYSFLQAQFTDLEHWRTVARAAYTDALSYHPPQCPLQGRTIDRQAHNGYVREEISFHTTPFTEVPATLLIPEKQLRSRAAIIALHDHGGFYYSGRSKLLENESEPKRLTDFRQQLYDGAAFAADYARAGYVVLTIDAFYFGDRRLQPASLPEAGTKALDGLARDSAAYIDAYNRLAGSYEHLTAKTLFLSGATWPGIITWDDKRSVEYLISRPEVNPNRIGCIGLSLGGLRAGHLAGLDPRIKSTVVCCFMSTTPPMLRNDVEHHTWMLYTPRAAEILDLPDLASLTAPNWLLVQYGKRDALFPAEGQTASAERLSAIFHKAGVPEHFRPSFWDVPHSFPKKMQEEALEWFGQTLNS
ncbi:MAG TPA: alpha/beta hydrolase family protein [Verrucomicrobiae bacterium]|nr:alpha/beta hydrolase family protein [Verrucomicrobiae bacterium]